MSTASAAREPAAQPEILIVDDIPMFLELESLFLARLGQVRMATSGAQALEQMHRSGANVAVVDLHLPDTTGAKLCQELRALAGDPAFPVILVTNGQAVEHGEAVRAGASDVISKPLSRRELLSAVSRMLAPGGPRGLPRIELTTPARIEGPSGRIEGVVRNLSRGGVFIESRWFPARDEELRLEFELPEHTDPLRPTAMTVWRQLRTDCGAHGMGMRFVELDRETDRTLEGYVHERFPRPTRSAAWRPGSNP